MLKNIKKILIGFLTVVGAMIIIPITLALISAMFALTVASFEFIISLAVLWLIGHVVYDYSVKRKAKKELGTDV